jgi:hypothetical protein
MTATTRSDVITLDVGRATRRYTPNWMISRSAIQDPRVPADIEFTFASAACTVVPLMERDCRGEGSVSRSRKPSVFQVGKIRDDGRTVVISGWGLGLCAAGCACHRHPSAGHLAIAEDQAGGRLGLATFDESCTCCEPWTADELAAILRDLDTVASLQAQEPLAG